MYLFSVGYKGKTIPAFVYRTSARILCYFSDGHSPAQPFLPGLVFNHARKPPATTIPVVNIAANISITLLLFPFWAVGIDFGRINVMFVKVTVTCQHGNVVVRLWMS